MSTGIDIKKKLAILNEGANVTTDATSIDFVGSGVNSSTVGNNVTVTIPGNSGNTTYYLNYSVPVGSYSEFSSIPTSATEQVVPWITNVGETDVAFQFETQVGVPNTTQIPAGLWQFFLHFNALSSNQYWTITPKVYKVDISSVETLLFTSDPIIVSNMPLTTTMYVSDGVFPATTLLATDRLIVKILLQNTGFNSQSLNFVTEGSQHYSVVFTTLNQVVPTGAVTSVTGTAPIVSSGGTTPAISIPQATGSIDGYLSSSDWSVFNAKVPATRNITINGTTFDLSADRTWTIATSIPQAQLIYVDSANGVNATTGRGDINAPYLTPEYALSNTTNTGTFTVNTATNTTLSAISDVNNALLEIGMYVSGSGIPFGTIIVAKGNQGGNANTVTLSRATTATATGVTVTWVKTYNVILNGSFIVSSSLFKDGMYINAQSAEITWGAFTLFTLSTTILKTPYYILGKGNYFGTTTTSYFISGNATQLANSTIEIEFGNITSNATDNLFNITTGTTNYNIVKVNGDFVNAVFGKVGFFDNWISQINFNSYGLLGGLVFSNGGTSTTSQVRQLFGSHETPSSVNVLTAGYFTRSSASLTGSTTFSGYASHNGRIVGTAHAIGGQCDIVSTDWSSGRFVCSGSATIRLNGGEIACTGGVVKFYGVGALHLYTALNGTIINYGDLSCSSITNGTGTLINHGTMSSTDYNNMLRHNVVNYGDITCMQIYPNVNGLSLVNYGKINTYVYGVIMNVNVKITNYGTIESIGNFTNNTAMITINNASAIFDNYGRLINNQTDITDALIEKTTGTLYLRQGSYLKVANSLSPIRCTANTSASRDVYYFGVTDNCNGTTYGLTFSFDGSSFAPNDLVGGTLYENVNY